MARLIEAVCPSCGERMLISVGRRKPVRNPWQRWRRQCDGFRATIARMETLINDPMKGPWARSMRDHYVGVLAALIPQEPDRDTPSAS